MADERYLAPMRRFWATKEVLLENYEKIFSAFFGRLEKVTVIIGKGTEATDDRGQLTQGR